MLATSTLHRFSVSMLIVCALILSACTPLPPSRNHQATAKPSGAQRPRLPLRGLRNLFASDAASRRDAWKAWGDAYLQDGDVIFLRGQCYLLLGTYDFTWLSTTASDSPFSHVAIAAREPDGMVAYDTSMAGAKRWTFEELVTHPAVQWVAVRRPHGDATHAIPAAVDFCRHVVENNIPYDTFLRSDEQQIYCSELVARAYQAGGVQLTQPTRVADLPGIHRINRTALYLAERLTPLERTQPVWSLGNDQYGLWSSRHLAPLLEPTRATNPPSLQDHSGGPQLNLTSTFAPE